MVLIKVSFVGYYYLIVYSNMQFFIVILVNTTICSGGYWLLDTTIWQIIPFKSVPVGTFSEIVSQLDTKILNIQVHLSSTHYLVNTSSSYSFQNGWCHS